MSDQPPTVPAAVRRNSALQALLPALAVEELAQLEASLLADGCRDALVVWQETGELLDGYHRYALCQQHHLPFVTTSRSLPDLAAAQLWVLRQQAGRRNLTPEQQSYVRGKEYELRKAQGRRTDRTSDQTDQKFDTARQLATEYKIGEMTVRRDGAFTVAVDAVAAVLGDAARTTILARETHLTRENVQRLSVVAHHDPEAARKALAAPTASAAQEILLSTLHIAVPPKVSPRPLYAVHVPKETALPRTISVRGRPVVPSPEPVVRHTPPAPTSAALTDLLGCAQRELSRRVGAYPEAVRLGTMTQGEMDHELAWMQKIVEHFQDHLASPTEGVTE